MFLESAAHFALLVSFTGWTALVLLPWQPWRTRERLRPVPAAPAPAAVSVLIPARNEADTIGATLQALATQGSGIRVVVVDDQSTDHTARAVREQPGINLTLLSGTPPPPGWTGKLWALEQGRRLVQTDYILLLDADILLDPGVIAALIDQSRARDAALVSVMAELRMVSFWEKLLCPAFIYFFKLLYPFHRSNRRQTRTAAAAGGCVLVQTAALASVGGFEPIASALIDDCALAARFKTCGYGTWIGLSRSVRSHRAYVRLRDFWEMVARTAYTQLRYSIGLLCLTTLLMGLLFWGPWLSLVLLHRGQPTALLALGLMSLSYLPTLLFYRRSPLWALALPLTATLFLLMTWSSAWNHWRGRTVTWRNRPCSTAPTPDPPNQPDGTGSVPSA